jgi:hypothetical protein
LLRSPQERRDTGLWCEHAESPHPLALLRTRGDRPRRRAADEGNELAAFLR